MAGKPLSSARNQFPMLNALQPPKSEGLAINLIVAVSFGLFVPRRILEGAKYGGLNVHPSILPEYVSYTYDVHGFPLTKNTAFMGLHHCTIRFSQTVNMLGSRFRHSIPSISIGEEFLHRQIHQDGSTDAERCQSC